MSDLFTATRKHDLPPKWDGFTIDWNGWHPTLDVRVCHPPKTPERCGHCGSTARQICNKGVVSITGLPRIGKRTRPNYAVLFAIRCPDCLSDRVWAHPDWFDIDDDDYSDEGSWMR